MKFIGNFLWLLLGGLLEGLAWSLLGVIFCLTIIFIPWGIKCFKIAGLAFAPFGKEVDVTFDEHPVANTIWMILFGWEIAVSYFVIGILFYISIIFIPFGKQCFKLAKVSMLPFGSDID